MLRKIFPVILRPIIHPSAFNLSKLCNNFTTSCCYSAPEKSVLADPGVKKAEGVERFHLQSVLTLHQMNTFDEIQNLKNSQDVIKFLKNNNTVIVPLYAPLFAQIFRIMQSNNSQMSRELLTKCPQFENLCKSVKKSARALRPSDVLNILKTLKFMQISMNSILCQTLLQVLSKSINELHISQLIFISYLIEDAPSSPIVDALKLSLPIVFDANVRAKLNYGNTKAIFEALLYAVDKKSKFETLEILVEAVLNAKDQLTLDQCKAIVSGLMFNRIRLLNKPRKELFTFCLTKLKEKMMDNLSSSDISTLTSLMVRSFLFADAFYYDEVFLMNAVKYAVENKMNLIEVGKLLRAFSRISYVDYDLINYVDNLLSQNIDPEKIRCSVMTILSHICLCSDARYLPPKWDTYEDKIINYFLETEEISIPLARIALELASLNRWHVPLIEKVFSEKFLRNYLDRKQNKVDYFVILNLYQAVKAAKREDLKTLPPADVIETAIKEIKAVERPHNFAPCLELLFGGKSYFVNKIITKDGHFIDHLLVLSKSGQALPIKEEGAKDGQCLENIVVPANGYAFAIFFAYPTYYCIDGTKLRGKFKLYIDTMATHGVIPVPISFTIWESLEDAEKLPYLKREIFSKIPGNDSSVIFEESAS